MNRTDRLVAMVMHLQGRRVVRAEELAEHFEISVRTVYRDLAALSEAGVPLSGEPGIGYSLVKSYHLPPVMFTADEAAALFVGGEMVKQFTDASLAAPMVSALLKIRSVLPRDRQDEVDRLSRATAVAGGARSPDGVDQRVLLPLQQAIVARRVVQLHYHGRERGADTRRDVEPLGVTFYGGAWYLVAWCRLRGDFRHFKLERVRALAVSAERFAARPDFSLRDHLAAEVAKSDTQPATVWFADAALDRARRESYTTFSAERPVRGGREVEMLTYSYDWLARWILTFSGRAVAVAPARLRHLVRTHGEAALRPHGES